MNETFQIDHRRTSADTVFDKLYEEIISLRLLPGSKMSEADVAARLNVSRQPVREAFGRLGNLGFLLIRPQKATEVQKFSNNVITTARFVRAAVEVEIVQIAAAQWDGSCAQPFEENLRLQDDAVLRNDVDAFHELDYDFHRQLCDAGGIAFAFNAILSNKAQIDRLCVLSMMDSNAMSILVNDHRNIYEAVSRNDADAARAAMRLHLTRLDATINRVRVSHPEYFV